MKTDDTASAPHPSGQDLLQCEATVRHTGTGLDVSALSGRWRLQQVWPRGSALPSTLSSALLRGLSASLELAPQPGTEAALAISNRVQLAGLSLCFVGSGQLIGKRPLLQFSFSRLELRQGDQLLWGRALPAVSPRRLPFFALIARDSSGWLAARGRGGGLALWQWQP